MEPLNERSPDRLKVQSKSLTNLPNSCICDSMKLLISNDDGIFALGIRTLANTLAEAGHDVTVVCPDRERSATGHGLTLHDPIRAEVVESIFHPSVKAWSCSGTPSDCVKLALGALLDEPPDFVLSGINHGSNIGTDVLYSGTVSAAMEGVIEGIPSIALSLTSFTCQDFQPAATFAKTLLAHLDEAPLPEPMLLNVNIPPVKSEEIAGVAITRQGIRRYFDTFEKRVDPRGKTYYWLAGEVLEEIDQPEHMHLPLDIETDVQAIAKNYITVTPLQYNLTYPAGVYTLQKWDLDKL
ncbi:MAG TPA: 5'/3'-nucleotidase SurE [Candidatus Obscuribacterales bacterium]